MMKGNFKRILAFLLMLTILASVMSVFATATDEEVTEEEEEEAEKVEMLLNRTFDEGWGIDNGFTVNINSGLNANFFVDNETAMDYSKNYFARLEFGDRSVNNADHYISFGLSDFSQYIVMQFDLKVDDAFSYSNRVGYSQIKSSTGQNNFLTLNKDSIGAFGEVLCDTSYEWVTLTYVFDFTQDTKAAIGGTNYQYGTCTVVATDQNGEELGSIEASRVWTLNTLRIGNHNKSGTVAGESFCLDNFYCYYTSSGRVLSDEEVASYGYGSKVSESKPFTVTIDKGDGNVTNAAGDPLKSSAAFKVGVEYCLMGGETRMPIMQAENGDIYGAPKVQDGKIYLPVGVLLDMLGYEYYSHSDGAAYDISSGLSATSIYAGRKSAIVNGENVYLSAAPEYMEEQIGENSYKYLAICIDDIETLFPGIYMFYDPMGLIVVSPADNLYNRETDMTAMLTLMKKFIYPEVTSETLRDLVAKQTETKNGEALKHPYIYATQTEFDKVAEAYAAKEGDEAYDANLQKYINSYVSSANSVIKTWAVSIQTGDAGWEEAYANYLETGLGIYVPNGTTAGTLYLPYLSAKPGNANDPNHAGRRNSSGKIITEESLVDKTNNGYDTSGGRLTGSDTIGDRVLNLAFAYQATGNMTYAMVAYELLSGLAEWDHWGPGHFLNCADSAQRYAVAYDWLYNAFVELETTDDPAIAAYREQNEYNYEKQVIADGLYWNGINAAYYTAILGKFPENRVHPELTTYQNDASTKHGSFGWYRATQNWNCVCNCGILLSCLALLNEEDAERVEKIDTLIEECYEGLYQYGLDCYAPDGSYPESAGYWAYGTVQFFKTVAAFYSATGTDLNLLDAPGIDKTCYYAVHICSSDNTKFGYHDGSSSGGLDTSQFGLIGKLLGDDTIVAMRYAKLKNGESGGYFDILYYDSDFADASVSLPLSYYMEGIETYVIRDSWEKGALFTALHGGKNLVNHGNIDAGTFIYRNDGIEWFCELGSDNYNLGGYFSTATRYALYRCNTEGQNTICLTGDQANIKYGQRSDATATTVAYGENEHGAYHILDMTECYYTSTNYGYRGIFVTNDYKTTVIQDDIQFAKFMSLYWFAHTTHTIEIDESGRVAYLVTAKGEYLRVTIVSNVSGYKFVEMSAYDTVLDVTMRQGEKPAEYDRSNYRKLAIQATNALTFNLAVVIERVDDKYDTTPCGYTLTDFREGMYDVNEGVAIWEPYGERSESTGSSSSGSGLIIDSTIPDDIKVTEGTVNSNVIYIGVLGSDRYGYELAEFYRRLIEIEYVSAFMPSVMSSASYPEYLAYKAEYNEFQRTVNAQLVYLSELSKAMLGF